MKLSSILTEERIALLPDGAGLDKASVIRELLTLLWSSPDLKESGIAFQSALDDVMAREAEMPTGADGGFAFPHARIDGLKGKIRMALGVCKEGVDFEAPDKSKARVIVLSVTPANAPNELLKARASLCRALAPERTKTALLAASSPKEASEIIEASGAVAEKDVLAKDLMRPCAVAGRPGMTFREAAKMLRACKRDALPVLDDAGDFAGEITAHELLSYGIPDFFLNLQTVSFVRHMDPFEKYFAVDRKISLADLKTLPEASVVEPDATLMEIVFEMAAKNRSAVHVVKDGKLLGTIDRQTIISRILLTA